MASGVIFNVSVRAPLFVSPSHAIRGYPGLLELVETNAVADAEDTVVIRGDLRVANRPAAGALPDPIISKLVPT